MQENLLEEYIPIDLHVHTPASDCYHKEFSDLEREYTNILKKYIEKGVKVIAITDHNSIKGYKELMRIKDDTENRIKFWNELKTVDGIEEKLQLEKEKLEMFGKILILPGVEFEAFPGIHLLLIFNPEQENIVSVISDFLYNNGYSVDVQGNEKVEVTSVSAVDIITKAEEIGAITIAAHIDSDKGALKKLEDSGRVQFFKNESLHGVQIVKPETIDYLKNLLMNDSYKRTKELSYMKFSDFHNKEDIEGKLSFFRMSSICFDEVKSVICDHPELISFTSRIEDVDLIEKVTNMPDTLKFESFKDKYLDDIKEGICAILNKGKGAIVVGIGQKGSVSGMKMPISDVEKNVNCILDEFKQYEAYFKYTEDYYELGDFSVVIIRLWTIGHIVFEYKSNVYLVNVKNKVYKASANDVYVLGENNYRNSFRKINNVNRNRMQLIREQMDIIQCMEQNIELNKKILKYSVVADNVFNLEVGCERFEENYNNDGLGMVTGNVYYIPPMVDAHHSECYNRITCAVFELEDELLLSAESKIRKGEYGVVNSRFATYYAKSENDFIIDGGMCIIFNFKNFLEKSYSLPAVLLWLKSPILLYHVKTIYGDYEMRTPRIFYSLPIMLHQEMKVGGELDEIAQRIINTEKEFLQEKECADNETLQQLMDIHNNSILEYVYQVEEKFIKILGITLEEYELILEFARDEGWSFFDKDNYQNEVNSEILNESLDEA